MKFLVFSDSHNYTNGMDCAIEKHSDIRHIIHCGDMAADIEYLQMVYGTTHSICGVCGNNDYSAPDPYSRIVLGEGHRIYVTHGHKEHVKRSLYPLESTARDSGCDICIFGHTHQQLCETHDGLLLLNPGSVGYFRQEYAVLDIERCSVTAELFKL